MFAHSGTLLANGSMIDRSTARKLSEASAFLWCAIAVVAFPKVARWSLARTDTCSQVLTANSFALSATLQVGPTCILAVNF